MATTQPRRRRRYTRAQRQEFLALYRRSGLSASAFVRQHDIKPSTLYQWAHRVKPAARPSAPLFKEVLLSAPPLLALWAAEIAVGNELTLRLGSQASPEFIAQVIHQLRRPC